MDHFVECYTLNRSEVVHGIRTSDYDSIISDDDIVMFASVQMIPAIECTAADAEESAGLSVSFVHGYSTCDSVDNSCILLSYNPNDWRLATGNTKLTLLDPSGNDNSIMLLITRSSGVVLESAGNKSMYMSVNDSGIPVIAKSSRASLMLAALMPSQAPGILTGTQKAQEDNRRNSRKAKHRQEARQ